MSEQFFQGVDALSRCSVVGEESPPPLDEDAAVVGRETVQKRLIGPVILGTAVDHQRQHFIAVSGNRLEGTTLPVELALDLLDGVIEFFRHVEVDPSQEFQPSLIEQELIGKCDRHHICADLHQVQRTPAVEEAIELDIQVSDRPQPRSGVRKMEVVGLREDVVSGIPCPLFQEGEPVHHPQGIEHDILAIRGVSRIEGQHANRGHQRRWHRRIPRAVDATGIVFIANLPRQSEEATIRHQPFLVFAFMGQIRRISLEHRLELSHQLYTGIGAVDAHQPLRQQ